ncbi:unnamed protein product [Pedinophyceae sp. YPF-701]|nr:unnamed protein product [Pedinophyceae sp. YPF-701]
MQGQQYGSVSGSVGDGDPPRGVAAVRAMLSGAKDRVLAMWRGSRPLTELLNRHAFSKPASIFDAGSRIRKNVSYFKVNYAVIIAFVVLFCFMRQPNTLLTLITLTAIWTYLFVLRTPGPLRIGQREYSQREQTIILSIVTILVVFFFSSVASVLFSALSISCILIAVHGAYREPEEIFDAQPPGGAGSAQSVGVPGQTDPLGAQMATSVLGLLSKAQQGLQGFATGGLQGGAGASGAAQNGPSKV